MKYSIQFSNPDNLIDFACSDSTPDFFDDSKSYFHCVGVNSLKQASDFIQAFKLWKKDYSTFYFDYKKCLYPDTSITILDENCDVVQHYEKV